MIRTTWYTMDSQVEFSSGNPTDPIQTSEIVSHYGQHMRATLNARTDALGSNLELESDLTASHNANNTDHEQITQMCVKQEPGDYIITPKLQGKHAGTWTYLDLS